MYTRVCIIGAGIAGLSAIHHISQSSGLVGTVFEASDEIGGVWVYRSKSMTGHNGHGVLYKNMRTNLPAQLMSFPDFPYPGAFSPTEKNCSSFLHHSEVLSYLKSYADHFELRKFIKFRSRVVNVIPIFDVSNVSSPRWRVTVEDDKGCRDVQEFDFVIVCNGHFSKPRMATIHNLEEFPGTVIHSKDYDDAEDYINKRVLIIGRGPSGVDILLEVAKVAAQVFICTVKEKLKFPLPPNTKEVTRIESFSGDRFCCEDGELIGCEVVIMCTGYFYDCPFLLPECRTTVESFRILPLYRDLVHVDYNTLCFMGVLNNVAPVLIMDVQAQYLVNLFEHRFDLPSKEAMLEDMTSEFQLRASVRPSTGSSHILVDLQQWDYQEALATEGEFSLPSHFPMLKKIRIKSRDRRIEHRPVYKNDRVLVTDLASNSFSYVEATDDSF